MFLPSSRTGEVEGGHGEPEVDVVDAGQDGDGDEHEGGRDAVLGPSEGVVLVGEEVGTSRRGILPCDQDLVGGVGLGWDEEVRQGSIG